MSSSTTSPTESARAAFYDEAIGLQAERVDCECVCLPAVIEGIQDDPDPIIVIGYTVTFTEACQNLIWVTIVGTNTEIDGLIRVKHPDLCGL